MPSIYIATRCFLIVSQVAIQESGYESRKMKAWIRAYNVAWCQMLYENQEAPNQPVGDDPLHIVCPLQL